MKEKAIKDFAQYSAEMKELERVIAHERRLKEFMTTKSNERTAMDDGQEMRRRQGQRAIFVTKNCCWLNCVHYRSEVWDQ